ncbi:MAG: hypothetical protein Q9188_004154 [Gyalolechia gomerana]
MSTSVVDIHRLNIEAQAGNLISGRLVCYSNLSPKDAESCVFAIAHAGRLISVMMTENHQIIMKFDMMQPKKEYDLGQAERDLEPCNGWSGQMAYPIFYHRMVHMFQMESTLAFRLLLAATQAGKIQDILSLDSPEDLQHSRMRIIEFKWEDINGWLRLVCIEEAGTANQ